MKDTIDMAREAGLQKESRGWSAWTKDLQSFEALVRADEREECAKACEELAPDMSRTANDASVWDVATFDCAAAIRARAST
jgi:hypothetical protein